MTYSGAELYVLSECSAPEMPIIGWKIEVANCKLHQTIIRRTGQDCFMVSTRSLNQGAEKNVEKLLNVKRVGFMLMQKTGNS